MRDWTWLSRVLAGVAGLLALGATTPAAGQTLVVHGRVTAADGRALAGATVVATAVADQGTAVATSDTVGAYRLVLSPARDRYVLSVSLRGFRTAQREVRRGAPDTLAVRADFRLEPASETPVARQLAPVRTVAQRPRPRRDERGERGTPGADRTTVDLATGLDGDVTGDLGAALATIAGVSVTPGAGGAPSVAAFGLAADQVGVTLNGTDVGAGTPLPRDGLVATVRLSTYDPKVGRAGGPSVALVLPSGTYVVSRGVHATLEEPRLQVASSSASPFGSTYANRIVSGTASGPLPGGRRFYDGTFQLGRRTSDLPTLASTLASASAAALATLGVRRDSLAATVAAAERLGIPVAARGAPAGRVATTGSAMLRVDLTPGMAPRYLSTSLLPDTGSVFYLLASGSWSASGGLGASPLAAGARLAESTRRGGQLLAHHETFRGPALEVLTSSVSTSVDRTAPYLAVPGASVRADGATTLALGGGAAAGSTRTTRWQTTAERTWNSDGLRHRLDVYADALHERVVSTRAPNALGTFAYASLADLAAGRPASFERALGARSAEASAWKGVLAVSDVYQPPRLPLPGPLGMLSTDGLTVQYGVRVDAERFGGARAENPLVRARFGRRTARLPSGIAAQPMAGFTWTHGTTVTQVGPTRFMPVRHTVSGGVRAYRGTLSPLAVAGVVRQDGLPGSADAVRCVGSAVPTPDWRKYALSEGAIPDACADGARGSALAETAPSVALYAPDYSPVWSWRGEMKWQWRFSSHLSSTLGLTQAINRALPGTFDLNFAPAAQFALPDEGGRPVFAGRAGVVPATGAVTAAGSRAAPELGRVVELRSDGRSTHRQATAGLGYYIGITRERSTMSAAPRFHGKLDVSYTYAAGRERMRGFDATTAGDPRVFTWSAGQAPRHMFQLALTGQRERWFSITFAGQLASGIPYTPLVGGDVNGDGLANDRAFVFDPAAATDSALGAGMRRLLDDAPRRVRDCLARQLGAIAAERSCRGPWYATLGVIALRLDPYRVGFRDRGSISLYVTNALGGIDQLLHGSAGRRGWGDVALPDAALLAARGFDAARPRYRYAVNPRFGSTAATGALFRRPAGLTIDVRVELGPDREGQALRNMFRPRPGGWGWPTDADSLRRFLYVQSGAPVEGDVSALLRRAGALRLTRVQVDTLTAIRARLAATRDSLYADLARFLAAREGDYGDREVRARWHRAVLASLTSDYEASRRLRDVLTPAQIAALEVQEWPPHFLSRTPDWFAQVTRGPLTYPW